MNSIPLVLAALGLALAGPIATAQEATPNQAFVDTGFGCAMYDGNGDWFITFQEKYQVVVNGGDTATLRCYATGVPTAGTAVQYRDFPCVVTTDHGWYWAERSFEVVDGRGNASLVCQLKNDGSLSGGVPQHCCRGALPRP